MAGPKFFIYGGCRWREVCTTTGRVDGWGNVQFLTVRDGRLQVARKYSVLRGLSSLAANEPTSVYDGPPLARIRHKRVIEKKKEHNCLKYQQQNCCCPQRSLRYNSDVVFNNIFKKKSTCTAAVQCSLLDESTPVPSNTNKSAKYKSNQTSDPRVRNGVKRLLEKRKRSASEDEQEEARSKNVKAIQTLRGHDDDSDEDMEISLVNDKRRPFYTNYDKGAKDKSKNVIQLSSSDDETDGSLVKKKITQTRRNSANRLKSHHLSTARSRTRASLRSNTIKGKRVNNKIPIHEVSSSDSHGIQPPNGTRKTSPDLEKAWETLFKTKSSRRSKKRLTTREYDSSESGVNVSRTLRSRNIDSIRSIENDDQMCKELVIGEEDVQLLRTFIEKDEANIFDVDLEKFDSDDNYKRSVFYKLNPLVNVSRCKRIGLMLREQSSQSTSVSLEDFISTLGLRSVLATSPPRKYKMRPRRHPDNRTDKQRSSYGGPDKENDKGNQRNLNTISNSEKGKVLVERLRDSGNKNKINSNSKGRAVGLIGKMSSRPQRSQRVKEAVVNSDSDSVFEKSQRVTAAEKQQETAPATKRVSGQAGKKDAEKGIGTVKRKASGRESGKGGGREYSRAEDEAVVEWVRGEGRARKVNGNQLWRELQLVHQQRTGHFRSWHSLRNRYLRYLLPALGELALAPPEAARLRAAAALGDLKSRKKPQRRNSLLTLPRVRSAWALRPRSPTRESPSPSASTARSLPTPARSSSRIDTSNSSGGSSIPEISPINKRRSLRNVTVEKPATKENESSRRLRSSMNTQSPTYSQLTRRFAPARSPRAPASPPPRPRTRRLFNPNAT